jgi:hypothetical protein
VIASLSLGSDIVLFLNGIQNVEASLFFIFIYFYFYLLICLEDFDCQGEEQECLVTCASTTQSSKKHTASSSTEGSSKKNLVFVKLRCCFLFPADIPASLR